MDSSCRRDQFAWHRGSWPRIVSHDGNTRLSRLCDKTLGWLEPFWWKTTAKDMWSTRGLCFSRESTSASSINNANNNGLRDQNQAWISGVEEVGVAGVPCSPPRGCSKETKRGWKTRVSQEMMWAIRRRNKMNHRKQARPGEFSARDAQYHTPLISESGTQSPDNVNCSKYVAETQMTRVEEESRSC